MRAPLVLAFVLALVGCGGAPDDEPADAVVDVRAETLPRWHASTAFSPEERAAILDGVAWLDAQSGRRSRPIVFTDAPSPFRIERSTTWNSPGVCLWFVSHVGGTTVLLNPANNDPELHPLEQTAAHELAHCELGFEDAYWPSPIISRGLMGGVYMRWTAYEANELSLFYSR